MEMLYCAIGLWAIGCCLGVLNAHEGECFLITVDIKLGPRSEKISNGTDNLDMIYSNFSATTFTVVMCSGTASG